MAVEVASLSSSKLRDCALVMPTTLKDLEMTASEDALDLLVSIKISCELQKTVILEWCLFFLDFDCLSAEDHGGEKESGEFHFCFFVSFFFN